MRDDMKKYYYDYEGRKFNFRILDNNITYNNGKYHYLITVYEKDNIPFQVNFILREDEIEQSELKVHEKIKKYVDNQGV